MASDFVVAKRKTDFLFRLASVPKCRDYGILFLVAQQDKVEYTTVAVACLAKKTNQSWTMVKINYLTSFITCKLVTPLMQ